MAESDKKIFRAALVTPEALVLEAEVYAVQFPAHDGMVGILTHRAPLVTKLGTGVLRLERAVGAAQQFLISGGYAQMKDNVLTILTDEALPQEAVTRSMIEAEAGRLAAVSPTDPAGAGKRRAIQTRMAVLEQLLVKA